ncbi:restriction endonuclease subunit S [Cesiribacter andamanensis]|uniref:EcoKI restriction-modification system protein HsdS n=1 Tax=Cesiribacter andamanensis AMV16 TaxID=1279009 RepID=M7NJB2_9BACT|nr:restriction endonuclease subunit S [Cesiribacter andamanensis]EMR01865.1 EcoKI restriction-modification system protein HsdS [Cesiribacter andamanensis AMV16]
MIKYNTYRLGDITEWKSGGTPPKLDVKFWGGTIPWISAKNLTSYTISTSDIFITQSGLEKGSRLANEDSILLLVRGSGLFNDIPVGIVTKPVAFNQDVKAIEVDKTILDPWYLLYWIKSNKTLLNTKLEITGIGAGKFDINILRELEINLPPIDIQKNVADIARCWDDKIALNRRMNQTLEQMAQTLFRQYFVEGVDEDNLPEGWRIGSLDTIANFLNGLALQKYKPKDENIYLPIIKIRELKNGITSSTEKADVNIPLQYIIQDGEVLFSWSGTLEVDIWCHGAGALNQHLFKVTSDKYPKWFYYYWVKEHLKEFINIAASKATTMGHIKRGHLIEAKVVIPAGHFIQKYDAILAPIVDKIINNKVEIRKLTQTRDTLLPKLMSGELNLTQAPVQHEALLS